MSTKGDGLASEEQAHNVQNTDQNDNEEKQLSPSKAPADEQASGNHQLIRKRKQTSQMLKSELKAAGFCGKNYTWTMSSLYAGLFMGTGSFLFATHFADLGFEGVGLCGPGVFVIFIFTWLFRESYHRCKTGSWTKKEGSRVYWDDGRLKWSNFIPLIGNVTANVSYLIVMTYAWHFAELGDINQGLVSALLSLASLINFITFYFGFGEKISYLNGIGVIFMVASVICIGAAVGSHSGEVETDEELEAGGGRSKTLNRVLAIVCGLGGPTVVSSQHFLIRKFKPQYDGIAQALDAAVFEFFILTLFLIPLSSNSDFTITWGDLALGTAAGLLMCLGRICVTIGFTVGLAGPTEALMSMSALLFQPPLFYKYAGQELSQLEAYGVLLGMAGALIMAYLDTCVYTIRMKYKIKKLQAEEAAEAAEPAEAAKAQNSVDPPQ